MKLLLSGEGPTDIGEMEWTGDRWRFRPGPMGEVVDRLAEAEVGYSILELAKLGADVVRFVSKSEMSEYRGNRAVRLRRAAYDFVSAEILGKIAAEELKAGPVVAVLFRDSDGTQTTSANDWEWKLRSMVEGFGAAAVEVGVPMLPRPKSEAWLLCALRGNPYEHCAALEDESGNDASPNSLKKMLAALLGRELNSEELADLVRDGRVDPGRIDMPSYNVFRERLREAIATQLGPH